MEKNNFQDDFMRNQKENFSLDHKSIVEAEIKGNLWPIRRDICNLNTTYNKDNKWFKGSRNRGIKEIIQSEIAA